MFLGIVKLLLVLPLELLCPRFTPTPIAIQISVSAVNQHADGPVIQQVGDVSVKFFIRSEE